MSVEMLSQSAGRMARIARHDLQFRVPARPHLCHGLVVVPTDSGLLLEGGPERQLLEGNAARHVLPGLLPLLDGSRSHESLAEGIGISESQIFQAMALLYSCGVLEHGEGAERSPDDIDQFLSRCGDTRRMNRNGREARTRLECAVIDIRGDGRVASLVATLLQASGIGTVRCSTGQQDFDATLSVAIATNANEEAELVAIVERARRTNTPVLRVGVSRNTVDIGPLFDTGIATCPACLAACATEIVPPLSEDADLQMAAAIAAGEIVHFIARVGRLQSLHGVARFRFDPWDYQVLAVPQILGCALCGTPAARTIDVNATTSPLLTYERMVTFPPRAYLDVKTHQRHYLQSNVQMQHERQQFPDTSCRPLPDVDPLAAMGTVTLAQALDGAIPSRATSENTADLASLLRLTFGMRPAWDNGDPVSRWVANGANMGSPQCYLAVGHHVEGVERGVYAYDAAAHGLCCLPADPDQLFAAVPHSSGDRAAGSTNALIVMTGALERLARKYESFAYRVIFLDAGCVLAQLRVAGASMGVRIAAASRWDDEAIARALNTDPEGEPITAAAWLSFPTNEGHGASR